MNVVPGGSFFQTVQGSAASNGTAQNAARVESVRPAENPGNQQARPSHDGVRGRIVDIVV